MKGKKWYGTEPSWGFHYCVGNTFLKNERQISRIVLAQVALGSNSYGPRLKSHKNPAF